MDDQLDKIIMECSFCGRSQLETRNMITSPAGTSFICDDCVDGDIVEVGNLFVEHSFGYADQYLLFA